MNEALHVTTPDGRLLGERQGGVARFLGIPYAQAPIGPLRLRSPRPPTGWTGVRDARQPGPASLQTLGGHQVWLNAPIADQSEDCLGLNVWTPDTGGRWPVLLWLHGGQTRHGHGAGPATDGRELAARGLVVVTINYRLGALGGLAHPALQDPDTGLCANWGLQDKLAALAWVQRCIACFGGDPSRVTLAGQSSGAANAVLIAQHGLAAGQYARVIAQSPPLFRPPMFVDLDDAAAYTEGLAQRLGVTVPGLRAVDGLRLQQAEHAFAHSPELRASMGRPRTAPVRDGRLLRAWPFDAPAATVPMLAGWTRTESDFWFDLRDGDGHTISPLQAPQTAEALAQRLGGLIDQHYAFDRRPSAEAVVDAYRASGAPARIWRDAYTDLVFRAPIVHLLGRQARAGQPAWAYAFAHPLAGAAGGAPHACDVPFVFGTWGHAHLARKIGDAPSVAVVADAMASAWAMFASQGDPGAAAGVAWPVFTPDAPATLRFGPSRAEVCALERPEGLACWAAYAP